ncbi:hydrogenase maturation nickel metallochaperone HypA [Morganella morganii]|uniref:hydrogenase maturation nickel metallochaperone HypA n=3 Tax=Enterobacterales TaxID=91347 RepID=UPI001BD97876|nr:hydrogenase maturation nickel metallochaperone HypA [Morganella morganii]MBT0315358.1 hydrogenase maturation nickel metallochaperone HypA [Morganella morganii subsp. morganii]MBT0369247.1 hydrogenase maturation nickel metallochaperone HypA [Morganella morganii subsp. morganii]MBT0441914.1 hydrogenase maturation nickel metallochaperone HypA [Morganella morganii subsp. morganii]MCU6351736.1 hydrogenase maturation nickel metallochaperone HypA [Morganella morganii]HCR3557262.1 hydrogenase matur
MHELSLCMSAADIIREQAEQHGIARVTDVWLEVGALADVEESALHFCFDIACRDTVAQGCTLHIDVIPAQAWCWDCSREAEIMQHGGCCPHCGSERLRISEGDDLRVKSLEGE